MRMKITRQHVGQVQHRGDVDVVVRFVFLDFHERREGGILDFRFTISDCKMRNLKPRRDVNG